MLSTTRALVFAMSVSTVYSAPISADAASAAADFASNVLMTSGASQFAMWVPTNGNAYSTSSLTCLNILSSSTGSCNIAAIDNIAALSGYTCAFEGSNGWTGSQTGTDYTGWVSVAPPQTIAAVACVAS